MKLDYCKKYGVKSGKRIKLAGLDPADTAGFDDKKAAQKLLKKNVEELSDLQRRLYAGGTYALLLIFQAIDAGGKDGTIRHVMSGVNPQGCRVTSFKVPSEKEASHDFLWRIHQAVPARGEIGIFNRSHYEEVLVVRVRNLKPKSEWSKRYDHINDFERMLADDRVITLKFFLHISKEEQKRRFEKRLNDPRRNWKFSAADLEERKYWDGYMRAFEDAVNRCSTPWAPWYVIPSDHKWFRNVAVSEIILETLHGLKLKYPKSKLDLSGIQVE